MMNKRIQKLFNEAGFHQPEMERLGIEDKFEKFAELIVRECCEVLEQTEDALDRQKWPTPRGCVEYIKDHFEVES
jgi:hypothetical protein